MTEDQLKQALREKGYTYKEGTDPEYGYTMVMAEKDNIQRTVGVKSYILGCSLRSFKQNKAYCDL